MPGVIFLRVSAPDKPALGAPCNGCGVCCTSEPCPIGILVSRRMNGACAALTWADGDSRYRCGLMAEPARFLPRLLSGAAPLLARLARRYIAAGVGCDCDVQVRKLPPGRGA